MAKPKHLAPEETAGDLVKNAVDTRMASGMRGTWKSLQQFGMGSFFKGAVVAAIVVVAVMALVGGYMGSVSGLEVAGQGLMNTFEKGMGAGISKGLEFLTSQLGLLTVAGVGLAATGSDIYKKQQLLEAQNTERESIEYRRLYEQEKQRNRSHSKSTHTQHHTRETRHTTEKKQNTTYAHGGLGEDGIYVPGSVIKDREFCAAELKRRTETKTNTESRSMNS